MATTPEHLGKLVPAEVRQRDAVHFPIIPVEAGTRLSPGQHVGKLDDNRFGPNQPNNIGIVDPFLTAKVLEGDRFYLFLYPNTITDLRHVWEHPAFPPEEAASMASPAATTAVQGYNSEVWLRNFAESMSVSYDIMMDSLDHYDGDEYFTIYGQDAGGDIPDAFWRHVETVTGRRLNRRATHFSCSC